MIKNKEIITFFLAVLYLILIVSMNRVQAQSTSFSFLIIQALDSTSNLPITNASIQIWTAPDKSYYSTWKLINLGKANESGQFSLKVKSGVQYGIYVYHYNFSTHSFDYAPAFRLSTVGKENSSIIFRLAPAMTLILTGEIRFLETTKLSTAYTFNIKDNSSSSESDYVHTFGTYPPCNNFLNLSSKHVIIPVDRNVSLEIIAEIISGQSISEKFTINNLKQLNLTKGGIIYASIEMYSLQHDLESLRNSTISAEKLLANVEEMGFYDTLEKQDLVNVNSLLEVAQIRLDNGQYAESYASLRDAYTKNVDTIGRLNAVSADASISVFALILFLCLTAGVIAQVATEKLIKKELVTIFVSILFFGVLYYSYPGCKIISTITILEYLSVSLGVTFLTAIILPLLLKEKYVSAFSLAKRHLKQRRLRFALTLLSVSVLVMGFVSLTSFSSGYGLIMRPFYSSSTNSNGILVKQPVPSDLSILGIKFVSIDSSTVASIQNDSVFNLTAIKAENFAYPYRLGTLISPFDAQKRIDIFGVIGIQPSAEAKITHIDRIVIEGQYLTDNDENSILISSEAAAKLNVKAKDKLLLQVEINKTEVTIAGIFDDASLNSLTDVDGKAFPPQKIIDITNLILGPCIPYEVVIAPLQLSLQIPMVKLSRIAALPRDGTQSLTIVKQMALEKDLWIFYSSGSQHYMAEMGSYLEARGTSILIPWVIVILSVVITMLNSIFEQRREIAILSSIGLNPSHITGLFIAEAAITGIIGGGIGYLLGLGSYKVMSVFSLLVEVRSKVSAAWSLASILLSLAAVLVGAAVALRFSAVITPSLLRRWKTEETSSPTGKELEFSIPIRVKEEDLESMFNYTVTRIRKNLRGVGLEKYMERIKWFDKKTSELHVRGFHFGVIPNRDLVVGSSSFDLTASRKKDEESYSLKIAFKQMIGRDDSAYRTTSFLRMALLEWSSPKK
ncbi:MAG: hypothetical protein QG670_1288 [Thermoproteota archaeon]|nr:hypothetical protein [Thermoproteota archaeon]